MECKLWVVLCKRIPGEVGDLAWRGRRVWASGGLVAARARRCPASRVLRSRRGRRGKGEGREWGGGDGERILACRAEAATARRKATSCTRGRRWEQASAQVRGAEFVRAGRTSLRVCAVRMGWRGGGGCTGRGCGQGGSRSAWGGYRQGWPLRARRGRSGSSSGGGGAGRKDGRVGQGSERRVGGQ